MLRCLTGDGAARQAIGGAVDDPHPTFAQFVLQLVAGGEYGFRGEGHRGNYTACGELYPAKNKPPFR